MAELLDSFAELANDIDTGLDQLIHGGMADLDELSRSINTIKTHASALQVKPIVDFAYGLEEIFSALRSGQRDPTSAVCEILQLGMDRLSDIHQREIHGQRFEQLNEAELIDLYIRLARCSDDDVNAYCLQIMDIMGVGFVHESSVEAVVKGSAKKIHEPEIQQTGQSDLEFFQEIAQQIDRHNSYWIGRSEQLLEWAQKMNELGGRPIAPQQLAAAVHLHDIGMSFIPSHIVDKKQRLNPDELAQIQTHPIWGQNYLMRVPGWDEAATIILHHHERIDGLGYPMGIAGDSIHPGAKILAIIDAFFSITNSRADREKRRSIIRAVSEINANVGTQFDKDWTLIFNDMLKEALNKGQF